MAYFLRRSKSTLKRGSSTYISHPHQLPKTIKMRMITRSMKRKFQPPALVIQRAWLSWVKRRDKIDPITQSVVTPPVFVHVSPTGKETYYTARILAEYVEQTGDYRNPLTREPWTSIEIMRLARLSQNVNILQVGDRERERQERFDRESLRTFFDDEIHSSVDLFINFVSQNEFVNTGIIVRFLVTTIFPPIIVTVARVQRNDPTYVNSIFDILGAKIDLLRREYTINYQVGTAIVIFEQFIRDIRIQVESQSFVTGSVANIDIGGLQIRIDLETI